MPRAAEAVSCVGLCGWVCVFVFLYFLNTEYQNSHCNSKVRIFWGSQEILAGPYNFKGLFEG